MTWLSSDTVSEPEFESVWTHLSTNVPGACAWKVEAHFSRPSPLWAIKIMSKSYQGQEKNVLKSHIYISCLYLKKERNNVISKFFYNKHNGLGEVWGQGGWKLFGLTPDESTGCWLPLRKLLLRIEEWRRDWTPQEKKRNKELPVSGKCQACGFCREAGFVSEKAGVSLGDRGASWGRASYKLASTLLWPQHPVAGSKQSEGAKLISSKKSES